MENKRDYRISYIRAIATAMVVFLHITQHFERRYPRINFVTDWLNLGLVMFFVLSAFLYSKRDINREEYRKWIFHRYAEIAVPSVFTTVCAILIFSAFGIKVYGKRLIYSILCGLGFQAFVPDSWVFIQLWFLTYILICYITLPIIQKINFKKYSTKIFWIGVILFSIIMQGILSAVHSHVSWGVLLRFYFSYALFRRYGINSAEMKRTMKKLAILGIPCVLTIIVTRYLFPAEGVFASIAELIFIYTQTFLGLVLFYILYVFFCKIKERKKIIKITDKYSYPIYLTHCLFIGYNTSIVDKFDNRFLGTVIALLLTVIASTLVLVVTKPINKQISIALKR